MTDLSLTARLYAHSSRGRHCRRRICRHQSVRPRRRPHHYTKVGYLSILAALRFHILYLSSVCYDIITSVVYCADLS